MVGKGESGEDEGGGNKENKLGEFEKLAVPGGEGEGEENCQGVKDISNNSR
jgi:hypothetical protein